MLFANFQEVMKITIRYMEQREANLGLGYCGEIDTLCRILGVERERLMTVARIYRRMNENMRTDYYVANRLAGYLQYMNVCFF